MLLLVLVLNLILGLLLLLHRLHLLWPHLPLDLHEANLLILLTGDQQPELLTESGILML